MEVRGARRSRGGRGLYRDDARQGGPGRENSAVKLVVQDPPVSPLVELLDAGCGLGGKQDVVGVEPRTAEPNGKFQDQGQVLIKFGPTVGVGGA